MKTTIKQAICLTLLVFLTALGALMASTTEKPASSHEAVEMELSMEDWMLNPSNFYTHTLELLNIETEESAELEDWMFNENLTGNMEFNAEENEDSADIEDWMLDYTVWQL